MKRHQRRCGIRVALLALLAASSGQNAEAQEQLYFYPLDAARVVLWVDQSMEQPALAIRSGDNWSIDVDADRWRSQLARIKGCEAAQEPSSCGLTRLTQMPLVKGTFELGRVDAQAAFFPTSASGPDRCAVFLRSSAQQVGVFKNGPSWVKEGELDLKSWLGTADEPSAASELLGFVGANPQAPASKADWQQFWTTFTGMALEGSPVHVHRYLNAAKAPRLLLIEKIPPGSKESFRDRVGAEPVLAPIVVAVPAKGTGADGPHTPSTDGSWPVSVLAIVGLASIALLAATSIPLVRVSLAKRLLGTKFDDWRSPMGDVSPKLDIAADAKVQELIASIGDEVRAAIKRVSETTLLAAGAGDSKGKQAHAERERLRGELYSAASDAAQLCAEFVPLVSDAKVKNWLDQFGNRLYNCAHEVQQKLKAGEASLKEAQKAADAVRQRAATELGDLSAQLDRARREGAESIKQLEIVLADEREKRKQAESEMANLRREHQTTVKELQAAHAADMTSSTAKARERASLFDGLNSVAQHLQQGQKHYFSATDDIVAAGLLGFLAQHSLNQIATGLALDRPAMITGGVDNLSRLVGSLSSNYEGYRTAQPALMKTFAGYLRSVSTPLEPTERTDARTFQKILAYLRDSARLDLSPFHFAYNDESGQPYVVKV